MARWFMEQIAAGKPSALAGATAPSAKDIAQAAQAGDALALAAFTRAGTFIGRALADYLSIFNPSIVILGGGVTRAGAILLEPLQAALHQYAFTHHYLDQLVITTAQLGDDAGLLGALALARRQAGAGEQTQPG
jgi:glucokinase